MYIFAAVLLGLCICSFQEFANAKRAFINPYPRFAAYHDDGDPGEPLIITPYLKNKTSAAVARKLALVRSDQLGWVESYSGYFTVNARHNSNMFFWYFPAETNQDHAPVVLWLQGGPGASSLFGLFTENGPFELKEDGQLGKREYRWNSNHHLLYIDNPVGTGFSYTDGDDGYSKNESEVGKNLHEALMQFFTLFPNLQHLQLFITGESYAGKYVPAVAYQIHNTQKLNKARVHINLGGVAIGNGLSDPLHQLKYGDYLYQLGLVDINALELFHAAEKKGADCIKKHDMDCAFEVFDSLVNMDQTPSGSLFHNLTGYNTYYNYLKTKGDNSDDLLGKFLQSTETRRAIHVGNNSFHDLEGENKVEDHLKKDIMDSVAPWVSELLSHYPVVIYSGQLDVIVAYPLTLNYLQHLKFKGDDSYKTAKRYIWRVDDEIAGYVKEAGHLVEILVRNAGHMAPMDQPKWVLDMITKLTYRKSFV